LRYIHMAWRIPVPLIEGSSFIPELRKSGSDTAMSMRETAKPAKTWNVLAVQ
jgi:hypothetical protein